MGPESTIDLSRVIEWVEDAPVRTWAPVSFDEYKMKEIATSIAESVANNILGNFFREITDENLKVDVDALQAYIDNFMKSAS